MYLQPIPMAYRSMALPLAKGVLGSESTAPEVTLGSGSAASASTSARQQNIAPGTRVTGTRSSGGDVFR